MEKEEIPGPFTDDGKSTTAGTQPNCGVLGDCRIHQPDLHKGSLILVLLR